MRKTRAVRAGALRLRLERGPDIAAQPFTSLRDAQVEEVKACYRRWYATWVEEDLEILIPELRKKPNISA